MVLFFVLMSKVAFSAGGEEYVPEWDKEDKQRFINECSSTFPREMDEKTDLCTCALKKITSEVSPYAFRMDSPQITGAMNACQKEYPWLPSLQKKMIGQCVITLNNQGYVANTERSAEVICSCSVRIFVEHNPLKELIKGSSYGMLYSMISLCKNNEI